MVKTTAPVRISVDHHTAYKRFCADNKIKMGKHFESLLEKDEEFLKKLAQVRRENGGQS